MITKNTPKRAINKKPNSGAVELDARIVELNNEIITLRETVFKQREEMHAMRNSRVLGRIIKAHDAIGSPFTLVSRIAQKTRHTVAKFVPDVIRLPMMKRLRKVRDALRGRAQALQDRPVRVIEIKNSIIKSNSPLVSVIVPYYNRADTIDDTLESLVHQTLVNFELIIVDDGSTDRASVDKLKEISEKYPKAHILYQKNQGVAMARNNGIVKAKGKYIVCLDSDDILEPTFLEKATIVLETNPNVQIVSSFMTVFGVKTEEFRHSEFDPLKLYKDNMIITAAMFTKHAWSTTGGYKSGIGYEDWEFWIGLVENGFRAYQIPESLFRYRTSMQSRYIEDRDVHWDNLKTIHSLHPYYHKKVRAFQNKHKLTCYTTNQKTAFINLGSNTQPDELYKNKKKVLIAIPWMTFGGAETLLYNFTRELVGDFDITFVTGLASSNEWEYKFCEVSHRIYHLPNLFQDESLYLSFISNYIATNGIDILHIVHTGYVFDMLPELKRRHPELRVLVTMFNDRVEEYVEKSVKYKGLFTSFTTDSTLAAEGYRIKFEGSPIPEVIPNGIDCHREFNPNLFDRKAIRDDLDIDKDEKAIFFVGRLSEEKNPDVFIEAMDRVTRQGKIRAFMVGNGPMRQDCERLLRDTKNDKIVDLGYQKDVAKYLSAGDIFVLPSSIEGFPLSILEAMSMSLAVVASKVGAVPDVIKDGVNGYVVTPGSVDEIVDAISKLSDTTMLNKIKRNNREQVEQKYSIEELGRRYNTLYREVLQ